MITAGIDIGSTTTKVVILREREILTRVISATGSNPRTKAEELFKQALRDVSLERSCIDKIISTGYGRRVIDFSDDVTTEISACAQYFASLNEDDKIVVDVGGQDTKAILIEGGRVKDFIMNDKCAAGTGKFLEVLAGILEIRLEDLERVAVESQDPIEFNSTCTVFAQSEIISALAQGKKKSDIVAGLHNSLAERISSLVKQLGNKSRVYFCGGGAMNRALKRALEDTLKAEVLVAQEPQFVIAKGAAMLAFEKVR